MTDEEWVKSATEDFSENGFIHALTVGSNEWFRNRILSDCSDDVSVARDIFLNKYSFIKRHHDIVKSFSIRHDIPCSVVSGLYAKKNETKSVIFAKFDPSCFIFRPRYSNVHEKTGIRTTWYMEATLKKTGEIFELAIPYYRNDSTFPYMQLNEYGRGKTIFSESDALIHGFVLIITSSVKNYLKLLECYR